jgi:hypothetical protein
MIGLAFRISKLFVFGLILIIASHLIEWDGMTLSDQVKDSLSRAQASPRVNSARALLLRFVQGAEEATPVHKKSPQKKTGSAEILESERARLRALLHDSEN